MKRKSLFLLAALTVSATLLSGCKASDSVDNSAVKSEATETTTVESEATETTEKETETPVETESTVIESTEATEEVEEEAAEEIENTDIVKGEPLSEKDLAFPVCGYRSYNEYIEAGNNAMVYMFADNATMVVTNELILEPEDTDDDETNDNIIESTVRGIKLGDSIDKVTELYGQADEYDTYNRNLFSHDDLKDIGQYIYFLKIESTKDYSYLFRFITDQNDNIIGVLIEPIPME